jgi:hypothetical protein
MFLIQLTGYDNYGIHRRFSSSPAVVDVIIMSLALQMKVRKQISRLGRLM